ncbi:ATPase [Ancylobacter sp. A5.8]|uniref:ATP12 family chaperone protein n=1 Tax=Ancylobacter gelatini TaxID=2919920 RepID=UPI001F4E9EDB|nr:ATP12 family protein [Ancylobacter gelatini]MCJ8141376.1 ATPase [Ancylobacter gelatini]
MSDEKPAPRAPDPAAFRTQPALPKRFYTLAAAVPHESGFAVALDGRPVRTPGRRPLSVPGLAFAEALAQEWQGQGEQINPLTMPLTRLVNSAIDGVAANPAEVAAEIVRYAGSDLLCYRADAPPKLVMLQRDIWDPVLRWAEVELGGRFVLSEGIRYVEQPAKTLDYFAAALPRDPLRLAALNLMTTLSGSALLSLAVWRGTISAQEAWRAAHIDEEVQQELWGKDREAELRSEQRQKDFYAAVRALRLIDAQ